MINDGNNKRLIKLIFKIIFRKFFTTNKNKHKIINGMKIKKPIIGWVLKVAVPRGIEPLFPG